MKFYRLAQAFLAVVLIASCSEEEQLSQELTTAVNDGGYVTRYLGDFPYKVKEYRDGYLMNHDIFWSKDQLTEEPTSSNNSNSNARTFATGTSTAFSRWPNNTLPYEDFSHLSPVMQASIKGAMSHWEEQTNIRFTLRSNQTDYIVFETGHQSCASNLGRTGGRQVMLIPGGDSGQGCSLPTFIHELGHAVGLFHEQSRADRDEYIIVYPERVRDANARFNWQKHTEANVYTSDLDFESIMLYGSFSGGQGGLPVMTKLDGSTWVDNWQELSAGDIEGVNKMYPSINNIADDVRSINLNSQFDQGDVAEVTVSYSAKETRDLIVIFQESQSPWRTIDEQRVKVASIKNGSAEFNLNIPSDLAIGDNYQFQIIMAPVGGSWNNKVDNLASSAISIIEGIGINNDNDDISSITAPTSVNRSANVKVGVNFSASTKRDLIVILQQNHSPWKTIVEQTLTVDAGNDQSKTISLRIPADIDLTDSYQFQTILAPLRGGWDNRVDNEQSTKVSATSIVAVAARLVIRARGNCGTEAMVLEVDGQELRTWNNVATVAGDYSYDLYKGGEVKVKFINDDPNGCDRNLHVQQLTVDFDTFQTGTATRTGCGNSEWLWCNGDFNFGDKTSSINM